MAKRRSIESSKERVALAREAGLGRVSFISVVAGVMAAYGAVVVLVAVAGAIASALGVDPDFTSREWETVSVGGAVVLGLVLLVSYLFGGYVAGRMARRGGLANGLAVFLLGVALVAVAGGLAGLLADTDEFADRLRDLGIPTTGEQWAGIGTVAGVVSLAAMLVGALGGGRLGERWHAKLLARAADPRVGTTAERTAGDTTSTASTARTSGDDDTTSRQPTTS